MKQLHSWWAEEGRRERPRSAFPDEFRTPIKILDIFGDVYLRGRTDPAVA